MKQAFEKFIKSVWGYTNTNAGSVILGGGITYIFAIGTQEAKIKDLDARLTKSGDREKSLQQDLARSEMDHRVTIKDLLNANKELGKSNVELMSTKYAYENSTFFRRHAIPASTHNENIQTEECSSCKKKLDKLEGSNYIVTKLTQFWLTAPVIHFFNRSSVVGLEEVKRKDDENAKRTQKLINTRIEIANEAEQARRETKKFINQTKG